MRMVDFHYTESAHPTQEDNMTLQNKTTTQRLKSADDGIDELVLGSRYDDESAEAAVEPQVESTGAKALVVEEETEEIVVGEADKGSADRKSVV